MEGRLLLWRDEGCTNKTPSVPFGFLRAFPLFLIPTFADDAESPVRLRLDLQEIVSTTISR